jgi:hypothetical protein
LEAVRVPLEVSNDLISRHEAIGIVSVIGPTGKQDGPVRGHEAETVPSRSPALSHPVSLEHDVVYAAERELIADRETGLTSTNDHNRHGGPEVLNARWRL